MPVRLFLLAGLLVAAGCGGGDYRPFASGKDDEVLAVVDSTDWNNLVGDALRDVVGAEVITLPSPEPGYDVIAASITSQPRLDEIKTRKNLIVAASIADTSYEAQLIKAYFSDEAQQFVAASDTGVVVVREDLWRRGQRVVFATAANDSLLARTLYDRKRDIRYVFESAFLERREADMFERGRQQNLEAQIMEKHGYTVNVQHDYFIARDTLDFLWLRRVLVGSDTWRSLYIYSIDDFDPQRLDSAFVVGLRDSLTTANIEGTAGGYVEIDQRLPLTIRPVDFLGRYALEMRGVWVMQQPVGDGRVVPMMAGAFVNYTFYDPGTRKLFSIDGMVFAPRYPKLGFLRDMDTIAHTFRTRQDEEQAAQTASR